MTATNTPLGPREARLARRLEARGDGRLFLGLVQLRGMRLDERRSLRSLFAVGGEGAIFEVDDTADPHARVLGKVAIMPWHKPAQLSSKVLRAKRAALRAEAAFLEAVGSPHLPRCHGVLEFENPLLDAARGGAFAKPEPCFVMERLGGHDLDRWLCQVHRGMVDKHALRRTLDRIVVGVVQALTDLEMRGYLCADLRPGNLRVVGRPDRRVKLLDAGGCVSVAAEDPGFPHVPSYLPAELFWKLQEGERIAPSSPTQAVMAGRTLYEVATGQSPKAGRHLDAMRLVRAPVSPPVAEVVAGLASGEFGSCREALGELAKRAKRRVRGG